MRAKVAIWIALSAWVLIGVGCSSIDARTKPRNAKFYPGVRNFDTGAGPGSDMAAGMLAMGDLVLSAAADTLLLPFDALHQPKGKQAGEYVEGTYAGLYRFGRERSDFKLLGSGEGWWLTGNIEEVTRRLAGASVDERPELRNPVFLVVEGDLSKRGHYGHLGAYRRELRVTKVLEVQQMSPDVP
jgi:uncharacterized protein YceK